MILLEYTAILEKYKKIEGKYAAQFITYLIYFRGLYGKIHSNWKVIGVQQCVHYSWFNFIAKKLFIFPGGPISMVFMDATNYNCHLPIQWPWWLLKTSYRTNDKPKSWKLKWTGPPGNQCDHNTCFNRYISNLQSSYLCLQV